MPDAMTDTKKPSLTADDVKNWLKANQNFLQKHPEVLDFLAPPKAVSGKGVADFQAYMVKRVREDRDDVLDQAKDIIETSRANMNNQTRVQKAILLLLDARNFEDFIRTITMDFAAIFDVDIISLVVEASGKSIPQISLAGVRAVNAGSIDLMMRGKPIVLESAMAGFEEVYGGGAGLVKSQALVRLDIASAAPAAMIAFGSRNPDLFQPGQGTELIGFVGQVVARLMRIWLDVE
jgi:uncharacterized protein YigA (DUF484 family)